MAVFFPGGFSSPVPSMSRNVFQYDRRDPAGPGLDLLSRAIFHYLCENRVPDGSRPSREEIHELCDLFEKKEGENPYPNVDEAVLDEIATHTEETRWAKILELLEEDDDSIFSEHVIGYCDEKDMTYDNIGKRPR